MDLWYLDIARSLHIRPSSTIGAPFTATWIGAVSSRAQLGNLIGHALLQSEHHKLLGPGLDRLAAAGGFPSLPRVDGPDVVNARTTLAHLVRETGNTLSRIAL